MQHRRDAFIGFFISVAALCLLSVGLLLARIVGTDSMRYIFLLWNLILAAVPLFLAWWLVVRVRKYGWLKWQQLGLSALFLGFLPNSFYLITDFVHLRETNEASLIYDVVLLASFMWSGLVLGYISLFIIHDELKKRLNDRQAMSIVVATFLSVSFAIYLGRYTRWNTWDILMQPFGLLFDVSDRFVNPSVHTDTYVTTAILFLIITSLYMVVYKAINATRHL